MDKSYEIATEIATLHVHNVIISLKVLSGVLSVCDKTVDSAGF